MEPPSSTTAAANDAKAELTESSPIGTEGPLRNHLWPTHSTPLRIPRGPDPPAPYLDVLSLQSRRLLSQTDAQIAAHEASVATQWPPRKGDASKGDMSGTEQLEELLESVRLLVEPLQIPDLSHTGVFHSSTSQLQAAAPGANSVKKQSAVGDVKLSLATIDKDGEVKLFYPTGAKKVNMREYIKETLQRHLASEAATTSSNGDLPLYSYNCEWSTVAATKQLGGSASEPVLSASETVSPVLTKPTLKSGSRKLTPTVASPARKHKKSKAIASPKASSSSPLLNPELTRQAKDIIAAVRANTSKINELIGS